MDDLRAITDQILDAIRRRDGERLEEFLHQDFQSFESTGDSTDRRSYLQAISESPYEIDELTLDKLQIVELGDTAMVAGIQQAKIRMADGQALVSRVAFTDIFRRHEDRWLLRLIHWTHLGTREDPNASP